MSKSEGLALVREWRKSGLSVPEFCRVRGVSAQRVRYWNQRLEHIEGERRTSEPFVVLSPDTLQDSASSSVEDPAADDAIEIVVGDRYFVRVPRGAGALADVLRVLRDAEA